MYILFCFECEYVIKSLFAYRSSQLIGHLLITVLASASPYTLYYCFTVKQAFGNLRLLAGYGAKPIGAGLGRDSNTPDGSLTWW